MVLYYIIIIYHCNIALPPSSVVCSDHDVDQKRPLSAVVAAFVEMNNIKIYFNLLLVVDFVSARSVVQYRARWGKPAEIETNVIAPIHYAHDVHLLL